MRALRGEGWFQCVCSWCFENRARDCGSATRCVMAVWIAGGASVVDWDIHCGAWYCEVLAD